MTSKPKDIDAIELALNEAKADLAAGRFTCESAADHLRRLNNAEADESWDEWFDRKAPSADFMGDRD